MHAFKLTLFTVSVLGMIALHDHSYHLADVIVEIV